MNKNACIIRKIYCGNETKVPTDSGDKKYSRLGSRHECLKRGFGIGAWDTAKKGMPANSLRQIPYIGEKYTENFKKYKIKNTDDLLSVISKASVAKKKKIIHGSCKKSNGVHDQKAINSVVLYLHNNGVTNLPKCKIVRE